MSSINSKNSSNWGNSNNTSMGSMGNSYSRTSSSISSDMGCNTGVGLNMGLAAMVGDNILAFLNSCGVNDSFGDGVASLVSFSVTGLFGDGVADLLGNLLVDGVTNG